MIEFPNHDRPDDVEEHACESYRDGDWVVFICPECHDYERRINWRTGETSVRDVADLKVFHRGQYASQTYSDAFRFLN